MEPKSRSDEKRKELVAFSPMLGWLVSVLIDLIDGSLTGRKALIGFVIFFVFSLIWYAAIRSVANYRGSMRK